MNMLRGIGFAALVLLAGCGDDAPAPAPTNITIIDDGDNEIVVPRDNSVQANAANASDGAAVSFPAVNLAPDGVSLVLESGSSRHATFGLARAAAMQMATAALGDPIEQGDNQECGAGPLAFANFRGGLTLYFQEGAFAGWDLDGRDGPRLTTAAGIGIGSTRAQLEAVTSATVEDTTIGIEFTAGQMSGLLSSRGPTGEITNLWAGVTCIAR